MSYSVPEGKLYNLSIIEEISHGNDAFVEKMLPFFIDTMPPALNEFLSPYSTGTLAGLGAIAQQLQPSLVPSRLALHTQTLPTVHPCGYEASNLEEFPE